MELTVKVKGRAADPAARVREILEHADAAAARAVTVEEVFPGLRSGSSAGLVSVMLPAGIEPATHQTLLAALHDDPDVEYVHEPPRRRPRR